MHKTNRSTIVAFIVFLIIAIGMAFVFWSKGIKILPRVNTTEPAASKAEKALTDTSVWQAPKYPYTAACKDIGNCIPLSASRAGHGGETLVFGYNPNIDDPTAQWGDCLQSVMRRKQSTADWSVSVQESTCPQSCKQRFSNRIKNTSDVEQVAIFEAIFINEGGYCVPGEVK